MAEKLADQFYPDDLGVDREYLHDEYLEVEEGALTYKIIKQVLVLSGLAGFLLLVLLQSATNTSALIGKVGFAGIVIAAMALTIRGLWNRLVLKREQKLQETTEGPKD